MSFLNAREMYDWYLDDVTKRHKKAMDFKKICRDYIEKMPIEQVKKEVENFYAKQKENQANPQTKTEENDFELFRKNVPINVIMKYFSDREEVLNVKQELKSSYEKGNEQSTNSLVGDLYKLYEKEIKDNKLEEQIWRKRLLHQSVEFSLQKIINEDFDVSFDPQRDKGNCTKGITISMQKMADKFGISLFPEGFDKEKIAHPKDMIEEFGEYVKSSESGLLRDIPDVKVGDIIFLCNKKNEPKHAMMVSGFDDSNNPVLLGYSEVQADISMFESRKGDSRKGVILDVYSSIKTEVDKHNQRELAQIMSANKRTLS